MIKIMVLRTQFTDNTDLSTGCVTVFARCCMCLEWCMETGRWYKVVVCVDVAVKLGEYQLCANFIQFVC